MKKLLGVTGCPTGIAHTYMAEEALKLAAEKYGCQIKVETNGAVGVENALTVRDIQEADLNLGVCSFIQIKKETYKEHIRILFALFL